jgi:hypothetical protein
MSQKVFAALSLLTLLAAAPVFAERPLKATIPFDFTVGSKQMPAGEYTVTFDHPGTVRLTSEAGRASCTVITMAVQAGKTPEVGRLVFNKYGAYIFLSRVWSPGYDQGRELRKSKVEIEVARNFGAAQPEAVRVASR